VLASLATVVALTILGENPEQEPSNGADGYSASAIGLAFCLFGLVGLSVGETRQRVCTWRTGFDLTRWSTLRSWVQAVGTGQLLPRIVAWRPWPLCGSLQQKAERAAACLCALAPAGVGALSEQAFAGAALAA